MDFDQGHWCEAAPGTWWHNSEGVWFYLLGLNPNKASDWVRAYDNAEYFYDTTRDIRWTKCGSTWIKITPKPDGPMPGEYGGW